MIKIVDDKIILNWGFKKLKLVRVMHPNIASARLLEKSGFTDERKLRKNEFRNKRWCDELRYSILKEEFKENPEERLSPTLKGGDLRRSSETDFLKSKIAKSEMHSSPIINDGDFCFFDLRDLL